MKNRYKLIITNNRIYKEVELPPETKLLKIGSVKGCEIRFAKDLFFEDIQVTLERAEENWFISCADNLYISADGVMKLASKELSHGDEVRIKYQSSGQEAFKISFMIDFDFERKTYDRIIDLSGQSKIQIGGDIHNEITLKDELMGEGRLVLARQAEGWRIQDQHTRYGVYVNGVRVQESQELKDYDFFSVVGYSFYLKEGKLYTSKTAPMILNGLSFRDCEETESHLAYPEFHRSTRIQYRLPEVQVKVQQPETKPQKPKKNLVVSLVPSLAMLILLVLLRGVMGGGGTFVLYSACTMSIGIIMSVVSFVMDGREYRKELARREEFYRQYIDQKEAEIQAAQAEELEIRWKIQEALEDSVKEAFGFTKRLFEKSPLDPDFLYVYLGQGDVEASSRIQYDKPEFVDPEDPISLLPEQLAEKYRVLRHAPIIADLAASSGIGVVGSLPELHGMLRNMTLDLALRHFYKEVKLFYLFDEGEAEEFGWVRWLRHVANEDLNIRNLACDEESQNTVLEYLYNTLTQRENLRKEKRDAPFAVHLVVLIRNVKRMEQHPVSRYFETASLYGVTFVFLEEYEEWLPRGCDQVVRLQGDGSQGAVLESRDGRHSLAFAYPQIAPDTTAQIASLLAGIYVHEVSLESELTKNITMYELLHIVSADDLDLEQRWKNSQVYKSMAAPLGVKRKNEVVYLDIGDKGKAHGPHGLVAGTTGSGKSEILQTYVLSMATLFHPYDVGFVIIDFKGGGMANQFKDLPHLIGTITNIDGKEIHRSLLSIKAELVHRQEVFSRSGVNHINDYIRLFKEGKVQEPMPHLIMIVDEFAELKSEFPDFMKEIVSAARIGRTLGIHLILATQKPSGVVDNQIWSNSKFKLCLKVQTQEDSKEVIKTPLAAEIVEPGRAYFQVGNNEIFELFQSAFSGARVPTGEDNVKNYSIYSVNFWGKRQCVFTNKKRGREEKGQTQLEALVEYVHDYCEQAGIPRLAGICLPPLPAQLPVKGLDSLEKDLVAGIRVPLGFFDDPEQRAQGTYVLNLSEANTYLMGASQSGKTTALQTILYQIMSLYTPEEVNVYVVDCGNMALKVFEEARHVGGVALYTEEERVVNLFRMIGAMVSQRKELLSGKGLGTHRAYVEAGFSDMPEVLLMIDNIAVFREHYNKLEDQLLVLSREGQSVGIHLVATGSQANAVGFRMLANFGNRIAFHCNEKAEYSNLLERCRLEPQELPGRGLCVIEKRILEFQAALAFEGEKEIVRVENMKEFIRENSLRFRNSGARPIPEVPPVILAQKLLADSPEMYRKPYQIPMGIDYDTVEYRYLDLLATPLMGIVGREKSGKANFLRHLLWALSRNIFDSLTEAYIVDDGRMKLEAESRLAFVREYRTEAEDIGFLLDLVYQQVEERRAFLASRRGVPPEEALKEEPLLLLLVNNPAAVAVLAKDKGLQGKMNTLIKQSRGLKVSVIFSNLENAAVNFQAPEMLKLIKESKRVLVLEDMENIKFCDVTAKQLRDFTKPIRPGDGYLFWGSAIARIKTIRLDQNQ